MNNDQINEMFALCKLIIAAVPATVLGVTGIKQWIDLQKLKVKENSAGETAIKSLEARISVLEGKVDNQSLRIHELHNDNIDLKKGNNDLIQKLMDWMQKK